MNYNRKIMRLELSAEKALNGGYYYAELLLPATDYELKDAMKISLLRAYMPMSLLPTLPLIPPTLHKQRSLLTETEALYTPNIR